MLYGVGKKGKRILLSEYLNLTVQIPFGVAFEKNGTENLKLNTRTKLSERKELEKQKEEALKDPCFKIDRKIREELAKETEKIVNDNLCNIREKDQKLGALILSMLSMNPITYQEIRDRANILGIEANALRVANITNQLGVCSCKVTKELYLRGVHYEPREYTGYFL